MENKLQQVLRLFLSINKADAVYQMLDDESYSGDDIIDYIKWAKRQYQLGGPADIDTWLEDRKPRIIISFCYIDRTGFYTSHALEFPKRGEDMEHGTEFEWYYSLREITDKIMALKVGETIPFKLRDDKDSIGSVTRLK